RDGRGSRAAIREGRGRTGFGRCPTRSRRCGTRPLFSSDRWSRQSEWRTEGAAPGRPDRLRPAPSPSAGTPGCPGAATGGTPPGTPSGPTPGWQALRSFVHPELGEEEGPQLIDARERDEEKVEG